MSYDTVDTSVQDADPVLLFEFTRGATVWRYCALSVDFVAMGQTWLSSAICGLKGLPNSGEISKDDISLTLPISNAMAASFIADAPDEVTKLAIFRSYYSNPTLGRTVWRGRVLKSTTAIAVVTLSCENIFSALRRMGLRVVYSRKCQHVLYGVGCNVDRDDFAVAVTVTNVAKNVVTCSALSSVYVGGAIKAQDGTLRRIVKQAGAVLTLARPVLSLIQQFAANPGGFAAAVYPGCDKSTATCRDTFHNLGNHFGFVGMNGVNAMDGVTNAF